MDSLTGAKGVPPAAKNGHEYAKDAPDLERAQQMDGLDLTVRGLSDNLTAVKTSDVSSNAKDQMTDLSKREMRTDISVDPSNKEKSLESNSTPKKSSDIPDVSLSPYSNIGVTPRLKDLEKERALIIGDTKENTSNKNGSVQSPGIKAYKDWQLNPISPYRSKIVEDEREESMPEIHKNKDMKRSEVLLFEAISGIKNLSMLIEVVNLSFSYKDTDLVRGQVNRDALYSYYRGYKVFFGNTFREFKGIFEEMEGHLAEMDRRMKTGDRSLVKAGRDVYGKPDPPEDDLYINGKLLDQLQRSQKQIVYACKLLTESIYPKLHELVLLSKEMRRLTNDFLEEDFPHLFFV